MTRARARAARNIGYTLNLPLPRRTPWLPDVRTYWQTFGDRIGAPTRAPTSKAIAELVELRAVRATPSAVQRMSIRDVNIVTERLEEEPFDLVIATNVFIYYDVLEQALALSNVEAMLKPGGFLLANFSAPNLTSVTIRPVETTEDPLRARARRRRAHPRLRRLVQSARQLGRGSTGTTARSRIWRCSRALRRALTVKPKGARSASPVRRFPCDPRRLFA